nr:deoxynucleoside kinase [Bacilli bacterium]
MNLVLEGINGSGKTTIINEMRKDLDDRSINYTYVSDLKYDTPLKPVLEMMVKDSVFAELKKGFKTSIFESLVFAANHHYIQEQLRNEKGLVIYDRDYISILGYQKDIIKNEYIDVNWEKFYEAFREVVLFQLKKTDLLVYVSVPTEENIRRTELRDNRVCTKEEKEMFEKLKNNVEAEVHIAEKELLIPTIYLDGRSNPKENIEVIKEKVKSLGGKYV